MQNEKEIIAAITLYLASEMHVRALADSTIFITSKKFDSGIDAIKSTATEIYTAIAPLVEAGDKSKADQIITNFSVGEKVWLYIGSVFQEHTVKCIHIQKGEWGNTYVRYEMELVSGWYPASAIYRTKEAAMADNR